MCPQIRGKLNQVSRQTEASRGKMTHLGCKMWKTWAYWANKQFQNIWICENKPPVRFKMSFNQKNDSIFQVPSYLNFKWGGLGSFFSPSICGCLIIFVECIGGFLTASDPSDSSEKSGTHFVCCKAVSRAKFCDDKVTNYQIWDIRFTSFPLKRLSLLLLLHCICSFYFCYLLLLYVPPQCWLVNICQYCLLVNIIYNTK